MMYKPLPKHSRYGSFPTENFPTWSLPSRQISVSNVLLLDGNYIQEQAAKHLCKLILTNDSITELVRSSVFSKEDERTFSVK